MVKRSVYYKSFVPHCHTLKALSSNIKLNLIEVTSFTWKSELSQVNYWADNFCDY